MLKGVPPVQVILTHKLHTTMGMRMHWRASWKGDVCQSVTRRMPDACMHACLPFPRQGLIILRSTPGVQGGKAARWQAGGPGDKAQEAALVSRVQFTDDLQEVADRRALLCVPARGRSPTSKLLCRTAPQLLGASFVCAGSYEYESSMLREDNTAPQELRGRCKLIPRLPNMMHVPAQSTAC